MRESDVEGALLREVARILREPADDLDPARSLSELGMDSVGYCAVSAFVEKQFGIAVPPEALFEFSSVQATAAHVAQLTAGQGPAAPAPSGALASPAAEAGADAAYSTQDVAIVGLALKLPGADDPDQYLGSDPWRCVADPGVSRRARARERRRRPRLPQGRVR